MLRIRFYLTRLQLNWGVSRTHTHYDDDSSLDSRVRIGAHVWRSRESGDKSGAATVPAMCGGSGVWAQAGSMVA
jgi:hypothetical protein